MKERRKEMGKEKPFRQEFRNLREDEISAEKAQVNKGGVKVLLWKSRFATADILDETVGQDGWWLEYSNENRNCTLHVKLNDSWVQRTGIGDKDTPKALADDSLNRAGLLFGIGRELFTAPEIFFPAKDLSKYVYDEKTGEPPTCLNTFKVHKVEYVGKVISKVTIGAYEWEKCTKILTFTNKNVKAEEKPAEKLVEKPVQTAAPEKAEPKAAANAQPKQESKPTPTVKPAATTATKPAPEKPEPERVGNDALFAEDEKIIIPGSCKGLIYGKAKTMKKFWSLVDWAKGPGRARQYDDAAVNDQIARMRKLIAPTQ